MWGILFLLETTDNKKIKQLEAKNEKLEAENKDLKKRIRYD